MIPTFRSSPFWHRTVFSSLIKMFSRFARRVASTAQTGFRKVATNPISGQRAFSTARQVFAQSSKLPRALAIGAGLTTAATLTWSVNKPVSAANVPAEGIPGTNKERTFIAVKPDGVQRGIIGQIIQRFEQKGYKLVAMKFIHPTKSLAAGHYDDLKNKPFFNGLVQYFSSGPIVAMVWEGKDVIKGGRRTLGATNPSDSAPGTIRGDFCIDIGRNIIHGSDSPEGAEHEIKFWFRANEIYDWDNASVGWVYEKP